MARKKINLDEGIVERNIRLTGKIMKFLLENPRVINSLPDNFELVILPEDDPDIREYNLQLLDKYGSENKPVVFARVKAHSENPGITEKPSIFVPIDIAA